MFIEYFYILIAIVIAFLLGLIIFLLSFLLINRITDLEKISVYECGFEPFEDTRSVFEVRFYLVAILFVIFDLEVTYLFPWILVIGSLGFVSIFSMFIFLCILALVFFYEWIMGALDW